MEKEAEDFLEENGLQIANRKIVSTKQEALEFIKKIKFPVVLKITGKLHKTDEDGVSINVTQPFFNQEFERLKNKSKQVLVQEYISGKQLIIGIIKDPTFGHVIMFGLGGIFVEVFKDISFRVCPITKEDATKMIEETKAYEILKGTRGEKPINFKQLSNILVKVSEIAAKNQNIKELDINPLIANENEVKIVDARIIFE